jgi:hypothetical protein
LFESPDKNEAKIKIPQMLNQLPNLAGITIVGFVHSHPAGLGFQCDISGEKDIQETQLWSMQTSTSAAAIAYMRPDGRVYKVNFKSHFISAPEGGRVYRPQVGDFDRDCSTYNIGKF